MYGKAHQETKRKLSESHKGLFVGEKHYLFGKSMPEKTKAKLKGRKRTPEQVKHIADAQRGKKMSDAFKSKISKIHKGRRRSDLTKRKISEALKGKSKSEKHRLNLSLPRRIPVLQYRKDGGFIKEWGFIKEAGESLGIAPESISRNCKGRMGMKSAGGFVWLYKQ